MIADFHSLKYTTKSIIFHPDSLAFLKVNENEKELIEYIENNFHPNPSIIAESDILLYQEICSKLLRFTENSKECKLCFKDGLPSPKGQYLSKLVLLISHACNMKCDYCSLHEFNAQNRYMTAEVAIQAIKKVIDYYNGNIGMVLFFGGEPLLNFDTIKTIVESTRSICTENNYDIPKFGIQTNGTLITDEICQFLKRHEFIITISLDGPKYINDLQRRFSNGKGTFNKILIGIEKLKTNSIKFNIEATITINHIIYKITLKDLLDFFIDIGACSVHIMPVMGDVQKLKLPTSKIDFVARQFAELAAYSFESLATNKPKRTYAINYIIENLIYGPKNHICYAGIGTLTIDLFGNIYPCYYLMSDKYYMGNVCNEECFGRRYVDVKNNLHSHEKGGIENCRNCWAKSLCNSCFGSNLKNLLMLSGPSEDFCIIQREVIDAVLSKIIDMKYNSDQWDLLLLSD